MRARRELPGVSLWASDGVHPTPAGTYLTACVLYATLTGRSPVGIPGRTVRATTDSRTFRPVELAEADAAALQGVAVATVTATPSRH